MTVFDKCNCPRETGSHESCWATPYLIPICLHCRGIDSLYAALLAQTSTCGLRIMEFPVSHQQWEQTEQATMMVLCNNQAAMRNRRDVLSPGILTRLNARRLGRKSQPSRCRRFPIGHDVFQRSFSRGRASTYYKNAETIVFMSEDFAA